MTVSGSAWLERFAAELNTIAPSAQDIDALLALAGAAAHASERTAAPISCWLAARAGIDPAEARAIAERLARTLDEEAVSEKGTT